MHVVNRRRHVTLDWSYIAPQVQLFAGVGNGWPHNEPRYHQLWLWSDSCEQRYIASNPRHLRDLYLYLYRMHHCNYKLRPAFKTKTEDEVKYMQNGETFNKSINRSINQSISKFIKRPLNRVLTGACYDYRHNHKSHASRPNLKHCLLMTLYISHLTMLLLTELTRFSAAELR